MKQKQAVSHTQSFQSITVFKGHRNLAQSFKHTGVSLIDLKEGHCNNCYNWSLPKYFHLFLLGRQIVFKERCSQSTYTLLPPKSYLKKLFRQILSANYIPDTVQGAGVRTVDKGGGDPILKVKGPISRQISESGECNEG